MENVSTQPDVHYLEEFYFYLVKQSMRWSTQMRNTDNQVFKESLFYIYKNQHSVILIRLHHILLWLPKVAEMDLLVRYKKNKNQLYILYTDPRLSTLLIRKRALSSLTLVKATSSGSNPFKKKQRSVRTTIKIRHIILGV